MLDSTSDTVTLLSVAIVDKAKQSAAFDILFFNALPTVASVDNGALSITDAEMASKYIGRVHILATDYVNTASNSDASVYGIGLLMQGAETNTLKLYAVCQAIGTPTYTSTSDLTIRLGVLQD